MGLGGLGVRLEGDTIGDIIDLRGGGAGGAVILTGAVAAPTGDVVHPQGGKCILGLPVEGMAIGIAHRGSLIDRCNKRIWKGSGACQKYKVGESSARTCLVVLPLMLHDMLGVYIRLWQQRKHRG